MTKKHVLLAVLVGLLVVGLSIVATVKYENRPKPVPGETLSQALQGQKNAEHTLAVHDSVNAATQKANQNVITTLQSQKATACSTLQAHRLTSPGC